MGRETGSEEDEVARLVDVEDEEVLERRRENIRGITRDYRLVGAAAMRSALRSGKASPASDASSTSSQQTLASQAEERNLPEPALYVLGGNEATHGLSDSLLSIVAHRAGELSTSLLDRLPRSRAATAPSTTSPPPTQTQTQTHKIQKPLTLPALQHMSLN
jgi:hypothetical protein